MKNRRGFTLVEMMLVIAIIVMLAGVTMAGLSQYSKRAKDLKANIDAHQAAAKDQDQIIHDYLTTTRERVQVSIEDTQPQPDEPPATTEETTTEALPPEPSEEAAPEEPQENNTGSFVQAKNDTIERGTPGNGIISITENADGSATVKLLYNQWNDGTVQITKNANGSYNMKMISDNNYFLGANIGYGHDFKGGFTLSSSDISTLESTFGLKLT